MILESIKIDRGYSYNNSLNPLTGELVFKANGNESKVQIELDEELSQKIIKICASELVAAANRAAGLMTQDIIESAYVPKLEGKS